MNIKFKDVNTGKVQARAVIEIEPGVMLNEVTILKKNNQLFVETPQKVFRGKDGKNHYIDIITFENDDKRIVWLMNVKEEYLKWRKENKVLKIYEHGSDN